MLWPRDAGAVPGKGQGWAGVPRAVGGSSLARAVKRCPSWTWDSVLAGRGVSPPSARGSSLCGPRNPRLFPQLTSTCLGPSWWTWSPAPWTVSGPGPSDTSSGLTISSSVSVPCPTLMAGPRPARTNGHGHRRHDLSAQR